VRTEDAGAAVVVRTPGMVYVASEVVGMGIDPVVTVAGFTGEVIGTVTVPEFCGVVRVAPTVYVVLLAYAGLAKVAVFAEYPKGVYVRSRL
jgi:hypothetical protein